MKIDFLFWESAEWSDKIGLNLSGVRFRKQVHKDCDINKTYPNVYINTEEGWLCCHLDHEYTVAFYCDIDLTITTVNTHLKEIPGEP